MRELLQFLMRILIFLLPFLLLGISGAPAQSVTWTPASKPWNRAWGTHRIIVGVEQEAPLVRAHLVWRRRDRDPHKKAVWVFDQKTGKQIDGAFAENVTNDAGDVSFPPVSGAGEYAVYLLPVKITGGAFPKSEYHTPATGPQENVAGGALPLAKPLRWECLSAHDGWNEMEVIATQEEMAACQKAHSSRNGIWFVEDAAHSVRMFDHVPERWLKRKTDPVPTARPGNTLTFQTALWAAGADCTATGSAQPEIRDANGNALPWKAHALNLKPAADAPGTLRLSVAAGRVFPVWWQVFVPPDAQPGTCTVSAFGCQVRIEIHPEAPADPMARLAWLDAPVSAGEEPVPPYHLPKSSGTATEILGRTLRFARGLPSEMVSHFNPAVTNIAPENRFPILAGPMRLKIGDGDSESLTAAADGLSAAGTVGGIKVEGRSVIEYDGRIESRWTLTPPAGESAQLGEFALEIPLNPAATKYLIGLGRAGGLCPDEFSWKWDVAHKNQDSVWIGAVHGGMRLQLKDEKYIRPAINIHYHRRPLVEPSWANGGKGGVRFVRKNGRATLTAFTGPMAFKPGQPVHLDFDLLVTPFHPLRTKEQWTERYYQGPVPSLENAPKWLDNLRSQGVNIVNIHQGNYLNPYINYPFLTWDRLKQFTDLAHQRGIRVKYYYTIRELSNWAPELFALRTMGNDVLLHGSGGGHPWGEEHLSGDYYGAWYEPNVEDVSFLTQTMGRWNNYYVEGLRWLCDHCGCDGIYLDDISFDRTVMRRAQEVLQKHAPRGGRIDLHSWNELHEGGAWANCANLFMDSFPFVDRLWFGEGHQYSGPPPEHFLVEISGIPFGLMGEMLEHGGNPWLGLVHGCTGRLGWGGQPRGTWKLWDEFGAVDAAFIGWWAEGDCPVRCADPLVKASVWVQAGKKTLVAVGNFAKEPRRVKLAIDWQKLGLDPKKARLYAPPVPDYGQHEGLFAVNEELFLRPVAGAVFYLDETQRTVAPPVPSGSSGLGRQVFEDIFPAGIPPAIGKQSTTGWRWAASPKAGTPKYDEGLVLVAPANVHGWLERDLPTDSSAVQARIWQDPKDAGQQWGPGIAVSFEGGRTLKVNRRQDGRICVAANGGESLPASLSAAGLVEFLIRWDKDAVKVYAGGPAMSGREEEVASLPRKSFPGLPQQVRIGKMPNSCQAQDHAEVGEPGFCRWEWLRIFAER